MIFDRPKFCVMLEAKLKDLPRKNAMGLETVNHEQLVEVHTTITKAVKGREIFRCLTEFSKYFT